MTGRPQDPLDLLHQLPMPEPDALRMETVIAAAGRHFVQTPGRPQARATGGLQHLLTSWRNWTAPAAAGMAALALVAVYLGPFNGLDRQEAAPQLADSGTSLQEPPILSRGGNDAPDAAQPPGRSFGARPLPQGEPLGLDGDLATTVEHYAFDDVEIVSRSTPGATTLALVRDGAEIAFDTRTVEPGTEFTLLDAFIAPGEPDLLLVRSRMDAHTNWDVFTIQGDAITLSGRHSLLVHDAPDRAGVTERLADE